MKAIRYLGVLLLAATSALSQTSSLVVIENQQNLPVPLYRVQTLYDVSRRLVAEEFKLEAAQVRELKLTLVLGVRSRAGYKVSPGNVVYLFLPQWNEIQFAYAVMLVTLDRQIPEKQALSFIRKAIQRVDRITPVSADRLKVEAHVGDALKPSFSLSPLPNRSPDVSFSPRPLRRRPTPD